ncbi:MAG: UDP-N-acetylmuramoyl-tripeptide--D-alanyl-D-alanine ligase [Sphingomonadales bacterium]
MEKWLTLLDDCNGISTDSRQITPGCMYIALKGEHFNGNKFAQQALDKGAKYAIVDETEFATGEHIFLVENGLHFLQQLARTHRMRFTIPVIAITGSNGKTSTKELLNCVMQTKYNVLCTQGNLNNQIGVPLTLLQLNSSHEIAIIEMGANKLLDIDELCQIASPTHGLITNVGKAHLEGFGGFEGVLRTKTELFDHVTANKGILFVNADDPILMEAASARTQLLSTFGQENGALKGKLAYLDPFVHLSWQLDAYQSEVVDTQMIGKYNFYNFLAALCVGAHFGVSPEQMNLAIASYVPSNKRSQVQQTNNNTLIVDCYNANPSSMLSALNSFVEIAHDSKIVILGDMLELGNDGPMEHQKILDFLTDNSIPFLTVGPIFKELNAAGFETTAQLKSAMLKNPLQNKLVLLKGSRGIALEQLIDCL